MCTLITIAYTYTLFGVGAKLCFYDCEYGMANRKYDKVYYVAPDSICPVKLYKT